MKICGLEPEAWQELTPFEDKTVIDPQPQLVLEPQQKTYEIPYGTTSIRVIDLICPLGFGQRAVIVAPPRTGKTILLQQIAMAIKNNYPNVDLIMLLVDERPEEVTEMRRIIPGQVFASCNDRKVSSHVRLGKVIIEYAKSPRPGRPQCRRMLDSLTRVSRAFNIGQRGSGKIMSGGIDANALEIPKRLFGSARKFEHGGSLTVIATALIDTGSRMDELIFREFKGTGNMELVLSRDLCQRADLPRHRHPRIRHAEGPPPRRRANARILRPPRHVVRMKPKDAMRSLPPALGKFFTNNSLLDNLS